MANFIKSYKELEAAFRFKRKNPAYPDYPFKEGGRLKFDGENGIFDQARNRFFNRLPLPEDDMEMVNQILNTIDVKKTTLEQYLNPHQALPTEADQSAAPVGQVATGEPAITMTGTPKIPTGISSFGKTVGVNSSIALRTGGVRVAKGLGSIFGGVARGGGNFGLKVVNGGLDRWQAFSSARSRFKIPSTSGAKVAWALFGAFFLLVFVGGIIGGITGTTPSGEAAPIPPGNVGIGNTTPQVNNIPTPSGDLREALISNFGITMNGFSNQQLQWAWEKLQSIVQTNFTNLTRGTTITAISGSISSQTGCKTVNLGTYNDQTVFKVTLTHELGHIIYWCNPNPQNKKSEHEEAYRKEGGVTGYASSPCYGSSGLTEDYAEMTAYYLNPNTIEITPCNNRGIIPFANGRYPLHYNIASSVLGNY